MLTVELATGGVVEIYCDDAGLRTLRAAIERLEARGGHDHLMTPSWSGSELTETLQGDGNQLVNHLVLVKNSE